MANIKGQIKRNRQNEKRRVKNKGVRSEINSRVKSVITNAESGTTESEDLKLAIKKIDKAVTKKILHKNTAARKKSRLVKRLNSIESS
ncbi:MAG TPA: 30S ribosomal protein S20 [Acidimicrobiales bacterium]|nr:30S ribosomal protein S20 [Acidimicrobiales bacterium]